MPATDTIILAASQICSHLAYTTKTLTQNKTYYVLQDCSPYRYSSYNYINTNRLKNHTISSFYIQTFRAFKDPYKCSFFPNIIIYWNLLPQDIMICPSVNTFREQPTTTVLSHLQPQI
jgi:hypothetical protein